VIQVYRTPGLSASSAKALLEKAQSKVSGGITAVEGELCFNVSVTGALTAGQAETLGWLLKETYEPERLTSESSLAAATSTSTTTS
jgi:phosphoribosylformylglycinamidine synthase